MVWWVVGLFGFKGGECPVFGKGAGGAGAPRRTEGRGSTKTRRNARAWAQGAANAAPENGEQSVQARSAKPSTATERAASAMGGVDGKAWNVLGRTRRARRTTKGHEGVPEWGTADFIDFEQIKGVLAHAGLPE